MDISLEAKKISSAFEDAKNLLVERSNLGIVLDEIPPSNLLLDPVIRRLRSAIDRWNSVEEKLRNSVSKSDPNHQVGDIVCWYLVVVPIVIVISSYLLVPCFVFN